MGSYNKYLRFRVYPLGDSSLVGCGHFIFWKTVPRVELLEIFRLDYQIRLLAQREESLSHQATASKKITDTITTTDFDSKIRSTRAQRLRHEATMFRLITELPKWLKGLYYALRRDPLWYMREEMVHDCAGRGGCCSRGCGCCAKRSLSENIKASGHCTPECWCCKCYRDSSLTEEDQIAIAHDLERLLEDGRYLRDMANWYFRPLNWRHKLMNSKKWKMKFLLKR